MDDVQELLMRAQARIDLCMSGGADELVDVRLLPRGTPVRALYPDDVDRASVPAFLRGHDQVRTYSGLPSGLVLCDSAVAVVPGTSPVTITSPETVALLAAWFDHLWASAMAADVPAQNGLSEQERTVLRLLAAGATDDAAAARLGTSARSVRRVMAGVMGRLGARSRFQAGQLAARRGWL
ncbi:LuxR C-terminal-related transcriptional regulator [Lentzea sp. BCCO 10_0061]|uniref:LuxR C-terminal-related transcriptional regulator n=1 Tax=Lentzea sokolovensis TaxID=3095429 RepID=A0ABU4UVY6_9PSEU|nr:LuxR C-terminal-related transcriptional regulator [Lentzea sp. BCCO 10_0061]MDX8143327.1 LuxR C-terminal-related transcriptional regulator [Lentzea sp. BCCO 10_0061]